MKLVVETDLGHDPDDLFALCYLAAAGVKIQAVVIVPGDPDQIAVAQMLRKEFGMNFPIGASKLDRSKPSSGGVHYDLLDKYGYSRSAKPDGPGHEVLENVWDDDCELFVIGPATSVGKYLKENRRHIPRATMQGGFLSYELYSPQNRLPDFEGKGWVPTFNLNGDRPAGLTFLGADVGRRQMCGKNICHTVMLDKTRVFVPKNRPSEFFTEAADLYLSRHEFKKFHDPTAAVCHLHPEVATWHRGRTVKIESGWGTVPDPEGDYILADIDYDRLWDYLGSFN